MTDAKITMTATVDGQKKEAAVGLDQLDAIAEGLAETVYDAVQRGISKEFIGRMLLPRATTVNLLDRPVAARRGDKLWVQADYRFTAIAQNLIDAVEEHKHLRHARILLVLETAPSKGIKDGEIELGKVMKTTLRDQAMAGARPSEQPDFVIKLNGDWLHGEIERFAEAVPDASEAIWRKVVALIDHELCHCGARIVGKFVPYDEVQEFIKKLGAFFIERCDDVVDSSGRVMVRHYKSSGDGKYLYCARKHEIQDFCGVLRRHGGWNTTAARMIDAVEPYVKQPAGLFD